MQIRYYIALSAAVVAASITGCNSAPKTAEQDAKAAENECSVYRSYVRTRVYSEVLETCTRRMGADYCRQCLGG